MSLDNSLTIPESEDEIDDPYIHSVSTEEFVETVEQASQEKLDSVIVSNIDDEKSD